MKKIVILIGKELLHNLIIVYFAFFTIGFIIDFFDKIDEIYTLKLSFGNTITFFILRIPYIISQINIYALIITCLVTINILTQHNEILVLLTNGITPKRIFSIFFTLILIINTTLFTINIFISPKLLQKSEKKLMTKLNAKDFTNYSDIFIKHKDGFIFIDLILPNNNFLINTYFVKINKNFEIEDVYYARVLEKRNNQWIAKDGKWFSVISNKVEFSYSFNLPEIEILQNIGKTTYHPEWFTFNDLLKIIRVGSKSGMDILPYFYQLIKKIGHVFYPLLLFYLIFPTTLQFGRSKKNKEILFTGLMYILIFSISESLIFRFCQTAGLNPIIPLFLLIITLYVIGFFIRKTNFHYRKV